MENQITYLGLKKLDATESAEFKTLCEKSFPKVLRQLNKYHSVNLTSELKITVKSINNTGKRKHYYINANLRSTAGNFDIEESDWNLKKVTHKIFNNLTNVLNKRLKL